MKSLTTSFKVFISSLLCIAGIGYSMLLATIWYDTGWQIATIAEGYRTFDSIELVQHSFKYLFWFTGTFGLTVFLFLLSTSLSERIKTVFALIVPAFIVLDIGSAWLIRYSDSFAWVMYVSGVALAVSFLFMFFTVQHELWFKKQSV